MIGEVLKNKYSCKENILEPKNCRLYIKHRFPKRSVTFIHRVHMNGLLVYMLFSEYMLLSQVI